MRNLAVSSAILCSLACGTNAQERLAAYQTLNVPRAHQRATFAKLAANPGDRVDQTLAVDLKLDSTVRKGHETVDQSSSQLVRNQQRTVVVEEVVEGLTIAARVRYSKCERNVDGQASQPPVVGKTYVCRRNDDDSLTVTRTDGTFASPDEFRIVSESMESLGRPNPLAEFLAGKTVAVGEVLELPHDVGAALLGSKTSLGHVAKFTLTLREVLETEGVARFAVEIETEGSEKTQMRLIVNGHLDVETSTCRTRRFAVSGPLGMATTTGTYSTAKTTYVRGKLNLSMAAEYN